MQSPKIGMIKLHLFLQKRVFTARATIMYLSIYMYLIIYSSFANSSTDITHLNRHARPGVTAYIGIDNKKMKYVNEVYYNTFTDSVFIYVFMVLLKMHHLIV